MVLSGNNSFSSVTLNGGILQMNSANALGAAPIVFNGGTLQLFDSTDISSRLSQAPYQYYSIATPSNVTFATPLTSVGGRLSKSGSGTLTLAAANSYSGYTTVSAGTLTFSGSGSLGSTTGTVTLAGGTLDIASASPLTAGTVYMTGANPGTIQDGTLSGAAYIPTFTGAATINASLGGAGISLNKGNNGTLSLGGANTYTGDTLVSGGGTLTLTFNVTGAPASDILNRTSALKLSASTLTLTGKASSRNNSQTISNLVLNPGTSAFSITSGASSNYTCLSIGTISRTVGGLANFTLPLSGNTAVSPTNGYVTSTANDASGILGGYATVGSSATTPTDWAVNNGSFITNYTGYTTLTGNGPMITDGASSNVRISNASTGAVSLAAGTTTINTLLLNDTATARTNLIGSGNTLRLGAVGGVLIPSTSKNLTIDTAGSVGTLTAGGAASTPGEIIVNNAVAVTNNAVIADNGSGAVALTKAGSGALVLNTNCTHTGGTVLNAGTLLLPGGTNPFSTNGLLTVIGGTLNLGGAVQTSTVVSIQGGTVTNGTIAASGTNYDVRAGTIAAVLAGSTSLVKTTSGSVTVLGNNTYTGDTIIREGSVTFSSPGVSVQGNVIVGMPEGGLSASAAANANTPFTAAKNFTVYGNGSLNFSSAAQYLSGTLTLIGGTFLGGQPYFQSGSVVYMTGGNLGGTIYGNNGFGITSNSNATPAVVSANLQANSHTFTVNRGSGAVDLNFTGTLNGNNILTKAGNGVLVSSGANSHTNTLVTAGTFYFNGFSSRSGVTVSPGATAAGYGTIGGWLAYGNANVVLSNGASTNSMATLAPGGIDFTTGSHILGTLLVGSTDQTNSVTFGNFTRLAVQLGAAPGSNDCLAVNGKISLASGGNTNYLDIGLLGAAPLAGDYTIATFNVLTGRFFAVRSTLPRGPIMTVRYMGAPTGNGNELQNGSIVASIRYPTIIFVR